MGFMGSDLKNGPHDEDVPHSQKEPSLGPSFLLFIYSGTATSPGLLTSPPQYLWSCPSIASGGTLVSIRHLVVRSLVYIDG